MRAEWATDRHITGTTAVCNWHARGYVAGAVRSRQGSPSPRHRRSIHAQSRRYRSDRRHLVRRHARGSGCRGARVHARSAPRARSTLRTTGALIPSHKGQALPLHGGTTDSLNWSGYAVTPSTAASPPSPRRSRSRRPVWSRPGFAATWTGIGGYSTSDLIQAGTAEQSLPANQCLATSTTRGTSCCPRARRS